MNIFDQLAAKNVAEAKVYLAEEMMKDTLKMQSLLMLTAMMSMFLIFKRS